MYIDLDVYLYQKSWILRNFSTTQLYFVFSTCQHKYNPNVIFDIVYHKTGLNASFQDFWCTNTNNHTICYEKNDKYYLKAKNSLHTTRVSSFKFVFIVFFEKIRCQNIQLASYSFRNSKEYVQIFKVTNLCGVGKNYSLWIHVLSSSKPIWCTYILVYKKSLTTALNISFSVQNNLLN